MRVMHIDCLAQPAISRIRLPGGQRLANAGIIRDVYRQILIGSNGDGLRSLGIRRNTGIRSESLDLIGARSKANLKVSLTVCGLALHLRAIHMPCNNHDAGQRNVIALPRLHSRGSRSFRCLSLNPGQRRNNAAAAATSNQ